MKDAVGAVCLTEDDKKVPAMPGQNAQRNNP